MIKAVFMIIAITWPDGEVTIRETRYPTMELCQSAMEPLEGWFTEMDYILKVWCEER